MSATDELRRLLDERGVEWTDFRDQRCTTAWLEPAGAVRADEYDAGLLLVERVMAPEQAVAATLGPGTCKVEGYDDGVDEGMDGEWYSYGPPTWYLSCGHETYGSTRPCYCSTCGRKVERGDS